MSTRTIYLITTRNSPSQRAHFGIFIPSPTTPSTTTPPPPQKGTVIHAIGAPMAGYMLEFKRNHTPASSNEPYALFPIGQADSTHIVDFPDEDKESRDSDPRGDVEVVAARVPTPGVSENFMAPVNDTTNRRCQEWTVEFVRGLVAKEYIGDDAVDIVHSKRDPPTHGIGLRHVG